MHKGDRVRVTAQVWTGYELAGGQTIPPVEVVHEPPATGGAVGDRKKLFRQEHEQPFAGLVIGKTRRQTGYYNVADGYGPEGEPPYLSPDKTHIVWYVESDLGTLWWREPITCLEADLEDLNGQRTD